MSVDFEFKKEIPVITSSGYTRKVRSSAKFIRKQNSAAIRKQLKNYESMKEFVDRLIDLATKLCNLRPVQNHD